MINKVSVSHDKMKIKYFYILQNIRVGNDGKLGIILAWMNNFNDFCTFAFGADFISIVNV